MKSKHPLDRSFLMKYLSYSGYVLLLMLASPLANAQKMITGDAFQTPSGNIHCQWDTNYLRCDMATAQGPKQLKPANCQFDYGNFFGLPTRGSAKRLCVSDTVMGLHPVLPYGAKWVKGGIQCESEKTGLTCINQSNQGFSLSKANQKLF